MKARRLVLVAAKDFALAGQQLGQLTEAIQKGESYSVVESRFVGAYYGGAGELQDALVALRKAGAPGLVRASDGRGIFLEAGCATCHTLAAAGATGTLGANLDRKRPRKPAIVEAVTNGNGVMVAFAGKLSSAQIQAVADFISRNEGR